MKNKKGFTLIELLAVLTILALVALITVPGITNSLKKYRNNLYENQIENIKSAARIWASDNLLLMPNDSSDDGNVCVYDKTKECPENYNKIIVTLKDLQDGGYIDKNLKNVRTKKEFTGTIEIVIQKKGKKLEYEVIDQQYYKYEVGDRVIVQVNENVKQEFYIIEDSDERSKTVKAILLSESTDKISWNAVSEYIKEQYSFTNTTELRLISNDEFSSVLEKIENDADKTWINGNYWTSTTYSSSSAYYVNTSELAYKNYEEGATVRPVIKINKAYVKLKDY